VLNAYGVLKFLHVFSLVVWVGGVTGLSVVTLRVRSERNREVLAALLGQATSFGQRMAGPASFIVLLTGPIMVAMEHIGFGTFWVLWGFAGLTAHFWIGATALRGRTSALLQLSSTAQGDDAAVLLVVGAADLPRDHGGRGGRDGAQAHSLGTDLMTRIIGNALEDNVALVTGSSRGIGAAIARLFAREGARVVVHGRDTAALSSVRSQIERDGGKALDVTGDVTNFADIEAMRQRIEQEFGPVEILVANAAGGRAMPGPLEEITEEAWHSSVDGTLTATFLTIKSILPGMKQRRAGSILTISSAAARRPIHSRRFLMPPRRPESRSSRNTWPHRSDPTGFASIASPRKPFLPSGTFREYRTRRRRRSWMLTR
jgi:short chain dehydrogenase/Predicted integral membrane protein (DUF2269)